MWHLLFNGAGYKNKLSGIIHNDAHSKLHSIIWGMLKTMGFAGAFTWVSPWDWHGPSVVAVSWVYLW